MAVETLVSLEEYLSTSYDPDLEYVDGVLEERNVGDWLHSLIQSNIIFALRKRYPYRKVVPELRSHTAEARYRLPDVSVLLTAPPARYLFEPAHIAIEILSEDDKMTKTMAKLAEYSAKGVQNIWLIDPRLQSMSVYSSGDLKRVGTLRAGEIELFPEEVFSE